MMRRLPIWDIRGCMKPMYACKWPNHHMLEQGTVEWHEFRNKHGGIGASAAAAVLADCASSTTSRANVKRKLRGEPVREPSAYAKAAMKVGHQMEPVLRDELSAALGLPIIETGMFVGPEVGSFKYQGVERRVVLSASLDGLVLDWERSTTCVAEFKWRTQPGAGWGPTRSELGPTVWCQVQQQMRCAGVHFALVYAGSDEVVPGMGEDRNLWAIKYSPGYNNGMFMSHCEVFVRECALPRATRRPAGIGAKIMKDLQMFMRDTVYKVDI